MTTAKAAADERVQAAIEGYEKPGALSALFFSHISKVMTTGKAKTAVSGGGQWSGVSCNAPKKLSVIRGCLSMPALREAPSPVGMIRWQ